MPLEYGVFHDRHLFSFDNIADTFSGIIDPNLNSIIELILDNCAEFSFRIRNDDAVVIVHPQRLNASRNKNVLTFWPQANPIQINIRPYGLGLQGNQVFMPDEPAILQRIQANYALLGNM